jgi:hypothetical protein
MTSVESADAVAQSATNALRLPREALGPARVVVMQPHRPVEELERPDRHRCQLGLACLALRTVHAKRSLR